MPERYRRIARVQKAHGRSGEVVTVPVHGLPLLVRVGLEVAVVPPPLRGPRWHVVTACTSDDRAGALVALSGVGSISEAERLVGSYLLARVDDLPEDLALLDAERLVGREVSCDDGARATIAEVMRGPANDVWVLRGERGELLLPVIPATVPSVPDEGPIEVSVPAGITWEA